MSIVNQILKTKKTSPDFVSPDTMVIDALRVMDKNNVGAILVMENNKLVGIFSERDYARKVILKDKASNTTTIREIMSGDVFTVKSTTSVDECMNIMNENNFRHLPVVEDEKVLGLISIGDLIRFVIEEQKDTIKNLEGYISGQ